MTEKTRLNLGQAIGELIESFTQIDKNEVMHLKIGLEAIHNAQKDIPSAQKTNLYTVTDYNILNNLLEKHNIPHEEFAKIPEFLTTSSEEKIPEQITSKPLKEAIDRIINKSNSPGGVPNTGMVAVMFNMVSDKIKNALVAGQAGERTLRAIERASTTSNFSVLKNIAFRDTLYDYGNKHRLARPDIDLIENEPKYLISAKAINHLADLFETSISLMPKALELESTTKSIQSFNQLASYIFAQASINLDMAQAREAAFEIKQLAEKFGGDKYHKIAVTKASDMIDKSMKLLQKSLRLEGIITEQEAEDYKRLVDKRIDQIKHLELV